MSGAVAQWGAFAAPPSGSNLAVVVHELQASESSGQLSAETCRPIVVEELERRGMPAASRAAWIERLVDERAEAAARSVAALPSIVGAGASADGDGFNVFAAAACAAVFFRHFSAAPEKPFEEVCNGVALELGPGVGAHEVQRLMREILKRSREMDDRQRDLFLTAISTIGEQCEEMPAVNLSVTEQEFLVVAGVIDGMRFR